MRWLTHPEVLQQERPMNGCSLALYYFLTTQPPLTTKATVWYKNKARIMCLCIFPTFGKTPESARWVSSRFRSYLPLQIQNKHRGRRHRVGFRNKSNLRVYKRTFDSGLYSFETGIMLLNINDVLEIGVTISPCRFPLNRPWRHCHQVKHLPELAEGGACTANTVH